MPKIGRNDPCPCGAKKPDGTTIKYKKCHLASRIFADPPIDKIIREVRHAETAYTTYLRSFGIYMNIIRPVISKNKKVWALGQRVYARNNINESYSDFARFILIETIGEEWISKQGSLPWTEKHFIAKCLEKFVSWREKTVKETGALPGERYTGVPDGWTKSLASLAFDITCLRQLGAIPATLVSRLKIPDQYQGARYELAVAAVFARLGFNINWIDPKSSDLKHCEFIAHHPPTGTSIAVEAKSRHCSGVIHQAGKLNEAKIRKGNVQPLINRAKQKSEFGKMPFVIFIDVNAPSKASSDWQQIPWVKDILDAARKSSPTSETEPHDCNGIYFTNYSYHYDEERPSNFNEHLAAIPSSPRFPLPEPKFHDVMKIALTRYGDLPDLDNIPNLDNATT